MNFVFSYVGRNTGGETVSGNLIAESEDHAAGIAKRNGFTVSDVRINANATVSYLTNGGFDQKELVRFYRQMGLRLKKTDNIDTILKDSSVFISDPALKGAIQEAANHRGKNLGERLLIAGFDRAECESIKSATADGGSNGWKVFEMISTMKKKAIALKTRTFKMLLMPIAMLLMFYVSFYGVIVFLAPPTLKFMKRYGIKLSDMLFLEPFYRLSLWVSEHVITFNLIYILILIAAVIGFKSKKLRFALTNWGYTGKLNEVNNMIMLWSQFLILFQSGIPIQLITQKISQIASTTKDKLAFNAMGRKLTEGKTISESIVQSDFPAYIKSSLGSAAQSDFEAGITDMVETLEIDQEALFERIESVTKFISMIIGFTVVVFMFAMIMAPNLIMSKKLMG